MYVTYKQTAIYTKTIGKGKPIVLLHGFLEDHTIWEELFLPFSQDYKLIFVDLFGHGKSEKVGYIHSMEHMAEAVKKIITQFSIKKTAIVGHSMGGYVALAFAEKFPKKVSKLILLNSTSEADNEERKKNRNRAKRLVKQNKNAFISMAIKNLFAEKTHQQFSDEINKLVELAQQMPAENIVATVEGLKTRKNRTEILNKFTGQKIIIAGKNDPVIPFKSIQKIAQITNSTLISLPNGHMSYIEDKNQLQNELAHIL